jgi:hypothetical protein
MNILRKLLKNNFNMKNLKFQKKPLKKIVKRAFNMKNNKIKINKLLQSNKIIIFKINLNFKVIIQI